MKLLNIAIITGLLMGAQPTYAQQITGAGSTFGAPIYSKWSESAKPTTGIELNYQAIGSGAGINQIANRTVDFGATDMPLSTDKLKELNLLQVPTVMGAVVVIANIPGLQNNQLRLAPDVLADIYLGKIRNWNDPRIVTSNPDLNALPSLAIAPIYRADGSGTTFVFTSYLGKISEMWNNTVGSSTSVKWPVGNGGKGNDGVAATVKQVKGGIGYVESAYASVNHLTTVQLMNADHKWVSPTSNSFISAADQAKWNIAKDYAVDLINQPGPASWPIVSATFVLIPTNAKDLTKTASVIKWLTWSYENGSKIATDLEYVPLPASVRQQIIEGLTKLN